MIYGPQRTRDEPEWDGGYGAEDSPTGEAPPVCPECGSQNVRQILKYNPRMHRDEIAGYECANCGSLL